MERRDKHSNPGNKIRALLCQPKPLNTVPVGQAGSGARASAWEGDGAVEEAGALPEVNRIKSLQNQTDWALQPIGAPETSTASGRGSSGSHSSCHHVSMVHVPGRTKHCKAGITDHISQKKNEGEAQRLQELCSRPSC